MNTHTRFALLAFLPVAAATALCVHGALQLTASLTGSGAAGSGSVHLEVRSSVDDTSSGSSLAQSSTSSDASSSSSSHSSSSASSAAAAPSATLLHTHHASHPLSLQLHIPSHPMLPTRNDLAAALLIDVLSSTGALAVDTLVESVSDGYILSIIPPRSFSPGTYSLTVRLQPEYRILHTLGLQEAPLLFEGSVVLGTVVWNSDKASYAPEEPAQIGLALSSNTPCRAWVLHTLSPDGEQFTATQSGSLKRGDCGSDAFSMRVLSEGVATLTLTNGTTTDERLLPITSHTPFLHLRRIAPTALTVETPHTITLKILPSESFVGSITETIPAGVSVSSSDATVDEQRSTTTLTWHGTWEAGRVYELSYTLTAHSISVFVLGPLSVQGETLTDSIPAPQSLTATGLTLSGSHLPITATGSTASSSLLDILGSVLGRISFLGQVSESASPTLFVEQRPWLLLGRSAQIHSPLDATPLELTATQQIFEADDTPTFRLMDADIAQESIAADGSLPEEVALTHIAEATLSQEDVAQLMARYVLASQSADVAEHLLDDSTTVNTLRDALPETGALRRDDVLGDQLMTALAEPTVQHDLSSLVVSDATVTPLLTEMLTEESRTALIENALGFASELPAIPEQEQVGMALAELLTQQPAAAQIVAETLIDPAAEEALPPLLTVTLTDRAGNTFTPSYHFQHGSVMLVLEPERSITPGIYTLTVTVTNPVTGEQQTFMQDFAWGVLALNAHKDVYQAGDLARIDMGVLDDEGEIVCNAHLTLDITTPAGETTTLSTDDASIEVTGTCGKKEPGFILPDFRTVLTLEEAGTYTLTLTARTENGERSLSSQILVEEAPSITIARSAATRLWPFAPSPMSITVEAARGFRGTITDTVPEGFIITQVTPAATITVLDGTGTLITWDNQDIPAGASATFSYRYDAPDISPQFYLVGPLTLTSDDGDTHEEQRSWQIANDGDGVVNVRLWDNGGGDNLWSTAANWSADTVPDSDDIAYFGSTTTANAIVDASFAGMVGSLKVNPGYTGTITLYRNLTLSGGSLTLSGGTLDFSTAGKTLSISHDLVTYPKARLSAGTGTIMLTGTGTNRVLSSTGAFNNLAINSGLVGYWKFDEGMGTVAKDSSGNGNNGTLTNGPVWSGATLNGTPTAMRFSNPHSLKFDGSNDYVTIGDPDVLSLNRSFTVAYWVKMRTLDQKVHLGHGTGEWYIGQDNNVRIEFGEYGGTTNVSRFWQNGNYTVGAWNFIAMSVGSGTTTTVRLYMNGTIDKTVTGYTATLNDGTGPLVIGAGGLGTAVTNGTFDDVRIYNRVLSPTEIQTLYSGYQSTGSGVYTLGSALDVNGQLNIVSGTLDVSASNYGVSLAGNFSNLGMFTKRSGTVTLDGTTTQTLTGSTLFHNLTLNTSTARKLFLDYSGQISASGALTLKGAVGNVLTLRSTRSGSGAKLSLGASGTQNIRYADIKDSNAGGGALLSCIVGCTNSGNNTNWTIGGTTKTWDGEGSGNNCSTAANWEGDTIPTSSDNVVFDDTSTKSVTWDASCPSTVASFTMDAGYTGTGTLAGTFKTTGNMTIGSGALVTAQGASGAIMVGGNLTVGRGLIRVRYWSNAGNGSGQLIAIAGNLTVMTGGVISADNQGFAYGSGPGTGISSSGGGCYGGRGGQFNVTFTCETYGSITAPVNLGGGAWNGNGGGAVKLVVQGATNLHGFIRSNATTVGGNGHGAGGSVYLITGTLSGAGSIQANGGSGVIGGQGSGGGGRVAVVLTSNGATFSSYTGVISAYGGAGSGGTYNGSAGTVYKQTPAQGANRGDLIIDNNSVSTTHIYANTAVNDNAAVTVTVGSVTVRGSGKLLIGGNDALTISGTGTALLVNSSARLMNAGILTIGGTGATIRNGATFTQSGSLATVNYTGQSNDADVLIGSGSYRNIGFNNMGTTFKILSTVRNLPVAGNLTITGGTLTTTNAQTLSLSGTWLNVGGAFSAGSGTVRLNGGSQTMSGSSAFYNLTKIVTTGATLTFGATTTQAVSNTLTLQGASSTYRLKLRSSQTGTQWKLNPAGTRTVSYLDIQDGNNLNASVITCSTNCLSSGNNTNWAVPLIWDGGGSGNNCSTAGNWNTDTIPTSSDHVLFDSTSTKNVTWDASCPSTVASFTMDAGYTGTGTLAGTFNTTGSMTIGSGALVTAKGSSGGLLIGGNLTIQRGTLQVRRWRTTGGGSGQTVVVGGNLTIATGGIVSMDAQGFDTGGGPGVPLDAYGASHGGQGGVYNGTTGPALTYGSVYQPTTLGSAVNGSTGGGAVIFQIAGSTTHYGTITANGTNGNQGGAGGSIFLRTQSLTGSGVLRANGGYRGGFDGAGAGGGRISIMLTHPSATFAQFTGSMQTYGGLASQSYRAGAAGTVYMQQGGEAEGQGTLIVDNNNNTSAGVGTPYTTSLPPGATWTFGSISLRRNGNLQPHANSTLQFTTLNIHTGGILTVNNTGSSVTVTGNVRIFSGGKLVHSTNGSTERYHMNLVINGNLLVGTGGFVNVNGLGFAGGPGYATGQPAGASHGGVGGEYNGSMIFGPTYGSIVAPITLGSGVTGGTGNGGGSARLRVNGNTTVHGLVTARGHCNTTCGAGGSVYLITQQLAGNGIIQANGSTRSTGDGGGSGGGRVAIKLTGANATFSTYTGSARAFGGGGPSITTRGAAGTVYLETPADGTNGGQLIIDNNNITTYAGIATDIRGYTTGSGTVGTLIVRNAGRLRIGTGATLTLRGTGSTITLNSSTNLTNSGTLQIGGTGVSVSGTWVSSTGSTTRYTGQSNDATVTVSRRSYGNLQINNTGSTFNLSGNTQATGSLLLMAGSLVVPGGQTLTVGGSWINGGGSFSAGQGTVNLLGLSAQHTLKESSSFNNLSTQGDLVAYWKFDEGQGTTVLDSSGNGNHGTLTSSNGTGWVIPSNATLSFANPYALDFDGVDDYIEIPDISLSSQHTYSFWVTADPGLTGQRRILTFAGISNTITYVGSNTIRYQVGSTFVGGGTLTDDGATWHHIAFTRDSAGFVNMYLNGVLQQSTSLTGHTSLTQIIGSSGGRSAGKIDDIRIYNRTLSAAEIAALAGGAAGSSTYTLGSNLDVNGSLTLAGTLDVSASNYSVNIAGNFLNAGSLTKRSGTVTFDGSGNQTISGTTLFHNLSVTAAAGRTLFMDYGNRQSASGTLSLQGASSAQRLKLRSTRSGSGAGLLLDGDSGIQSLSSLDVKDSNAAGGATLACSVGCLNSGSNTNWTFPWSGTVYSDEGSTPLASKTVALSINGGVPTTATTNASGQWTMTTTPPSVGDVISIYLDNESQNAALVTVTDGVSLGGMDLYQDRLIVRHETGSTIRGSHLTTALTVGDTDLSDFYASNAAGVITSMGTELYVWSGSTFHPGGTLATDDLDVRGTLRLGGKTLAISGSARASVGRLTATGTTTIDAASSETIAFSGSTLSTLQFTGGGTYTLSGALRASSSLRIQAGTLDLNGHRLTTTAATFRNDDTLRLRGSETLTGFSNDTSSGTVVFNGSSSYTGLTGLTSFRHLSFSGAGTWTLTAPITVNGTLTLSGGTLDVSASNYGISTRSWRDASAGTFVERRGTVSFSSTGSITTNEAFSGVLLRGQATHITLRSSVPIAGNLTLSGGTLSLPASSTHTLTLSGSWLTKPSASFSPGSGTVILDSGTHQTLSGSTTFYNVTKQVSSASNLIVAATTTQTVKGTLTLAGSVAGNLSLRSTLSGRQWRIDPQGTRNLQYITPIDSNNINASTILCSNDCVNGGGNTGWAFPITVTAYDEDGNLLQGVDIALAINGNGTGKTVATTNASGVATFTSVSVSSGNILTMWLDGETQKAVSITRTNGTSLGFTLYEDTLLLSQEAGGYLTSSDVGTGTLVNDSDVSTLITYSYSSASGHLLSMEEDFTTLRIKTGSTFRATGEGNWYDVDIDGTFNMGDWNQTVRGSWDASTGTFSGTNNVIFQTDRPQTITSNGNAFSDVTFRIPHEGAQGTWIATDELTITSTQTITITNDVSSFLGPVISNISATASDTEATISWNTSQNATSRLLYGTSSGALTSEVSDATLRSTHSLELSSLTPSTQYYYRIIATNNASQTTTGSIFSFNTLSEQITQADVDAARAEGAAQAASGGGGGGGSRSTCSAGRGRNMLAINDLEIEPLPSGKARVSWTTNADAVSIVNYGIESTDEYSANDLSTFVSSHEVTLARLSTATYRAVAVAIDACGNIATSDEQEFTATGDPSFLSGALLDAVPGASPDMLEAVRKRFLQMLLNMRDALSLDDFKAYVDAQLSATTEVTSAIPGPALAGEPKVTVTDTTATIEWTTDEEADASVSYASESVYEEDGYVASVKAEGTYTTAHSITLRELQPGTRYHYALTSATSYGTRSVSRDFTFLTTQQTASILNYTMEVTSPTSITFRWQTNVPATSAITVTPYRADILAVDSARTTALTDLTTEHTLTLTELEAGVQYQVELWGKTLNGSTLSKIIPRVLTSGEDVPPIISRVQTETALSPGKESRVQTVVSWRTNEEGTSRVFFQEGVGTATGSTLTESTTPDANYTRTHTVVLPSLRPGTIYSFQVESIDANGNAGRSQTFTLLTPRQEEGVFDVILGQMEKAFGWVGKLQGR